MKNILRATIAVIMVLGTALSASAESRWGIVAGANYNEVHFKQPDIFKSDRQFGPNLGVTGELMAPGIGFGIEAGLIYSMRSGKLHLGDKRVFSSVGLGTETAMMHYIDIPINLKLRWHKLNGFENTLMPMIFAGPTISILPAHSKINDQVSYKNVSLSMQLGIGAEIMRRYQVKVGYQFGVGETLHTKLLDEHVAKNRTWFVQGTYFFKASE